MVEKSWDDLPATRWESLPVKFNMGFPYIQYINHEGWTFRYTFSKNATESFLVMDVVRVYDQLTVFHGKINPYDIVFARDPVTKLKRWMWFAFEIDFDKEIAEIYVFHVPEWIK